jgi:hypothetical protein
LATTRLALQRRLQRTITRYATATRAGRLALLPTTLLAGKYYEVHVLSIVLAALSRDEGLRIELSNGSLVPLKMSPGPVNRVYPHFDLFRGVVAFGELWTDVEFMTLSYVLRQPAPLDSSAYHELDLLITRPLTTGRPVPEDVWLGVECKNTTYGKDLLRQILGIRRELSLLVDPGPTLFTSWPRTLVPANPPSCLSVYSTDSMVTAFRDGPGARFGIDFECESIGPPP